MLFSSELQLCSRLLIKAVYIVLAYIYRYVTPNLMEITYAISTEFTYLRNMLTKVEVTIKENTNITNSIRWECITAKQFNSKMGDDCISLLLSANNNNNNNNKVCFIWIKL